MRENEPERKMIDGCWLLLWGTMTVSQSRTRREEKVSNLRTNNDEVRGSDKGT